MKLVSFDDVIDVTLLLQMKNLIDRTIASEKDAAVGNSLFFHEAPIVSMEAQYSLSYPGEVLERYEERCGGGIEQIRALAIALAEKKELLDESMFIGKQQIHFLRKIRKLANNDSYLCCALYLLTDSNEEEEQMYQMILTNSYNNSLEAMFAISVLRNRGDSWLFIKNLAVQFLGKKRSIAAYGNEYLYVWFLEEFWSKIKAEKKRDGQLLKALLELPKRFVKDTVPAWNRLLDYGYSENEIRYLNLVLPGTIRVPDVLSRSSITMERMALAAMKEWINAEVLDNDYLYELCRKILLEYQHYSICLEENAGIVQSLNYLICIKNEKIYYFLYQNQENLRLPENWFYVDFDVNQWQYLYSVIDIKNFIEIFAESLCLFGKKTVTDWLQNYMQITGESLLDIFWKDSSSSIKKAFHILVETGQCNLLDLLQQYNTHKKDLTDTELQNTWVYMKKNIYEEVKDLKSRAAYQFWEKFIELYDLRNLELFFNDKNMVFDAVGIRTYNPYFKTIDFHESTLSLDEQRKLFDWIEQMVYWKMPERYEDFLCSFLLKDSAKIIFPEESKSLFYELKDSIENTAIRNSLCRIYFTEEEWQAYQKQEKEKQKELERLDKQKELETYRNKVEEELNAAEDRSDEMIRLASFFPTYYSRNIDEFFFCLQLLEQKLDESAEIVKKAASKIMESILYQFKHGRINWTSVQKLISKMEVIEYESTED
ncbi:MAG: hypothetical protein PHW34_13450 [Hespellia sp.]|nr:hypothetical protein [Hespellia sp.]